MPVGGARRWLAGAGAALIVAGTATVGLVTTTAAPAGAAESCSVVQTHYIDQPSAALEELAIPQSWKYATGKGVTVAVVDSGVDASNAHLGSAVLAGTSLIGGSGRTDFYGHGTAVAGIIAGRHLTKPQSALIGVAPDAKILPVRVFNAEATQPGEQVADPPNTRLMADGIRWAAAHGAKVINVSMSTDAKDPDLGVLKSAVDFAWHKGAVIVAAGGNQTSDTALTSERYPAGFPHVIGVSASNTDGYVDNWSIHGAQIDVSAPGADVLIAFHGAGDCLAGSDHAYSSWSTGFVSGLAAQLVQRYPDETPDQIAYRIEASALRPVQGERDDQQGWGLIQPLAALTMTLDDRRAGPPYPGAKAATPAVSSAAPPAVLSKSDPWAPVRHDALWWGLGAVGLATLAILTRPLMRLRSEGGRTRPEGRRRRTT